MADVDPGFPTDVTQEEDNAGFVACTVKNPNGGYGMPFGMSGPDPEIQAVVRDLGNGLRAVKMAFPVTGGIRYAIWNDKDRPVDGPYHSLEALQQKYP